MALDRGDVKRRVMDIAAALIAEGGGDALQARTIAKRAGISVGSIYNLVGDMDALHRAVNSELLDELGAAGTIAMHELEARGEHDVRRRLLALADAYLRFVTAHAVQWNALLAYNRSIASADTPEGYMARLEMLFDIIGDELKHTVLGEDAARRTVAARALWSAVHGIVTNTFVGRADHLLETTARGQIDMLVTMFVRGLEATNAADLPET
ncbi:MAG: TetR/AcrR family transcriptional regulator [Phyllobacteriaceae bacterium]|nr:TetR/AcrR family transcriptional regulator [Phyllobacteriaceae bacterium]